MVILFTLTIYIFSFLIFAPQTYAQAAVTRIRGNVYNQTSGLVGIGGLTVNVTCKGITKNDVTDSFGLYTIDYTPSECPAFAPVTSVVTHNGDTQTQTVLVSHVNTATLDFYYGSVGVPEFGGITGALTAIGSGLVFLNLKKRLTY